MKNRIGIIIQARVDSTRLPNKMILPFYEGKSILKIIIEKIKHSFNLPIVLATTINPKDDILQEVANAYNIKWYRGSESDVLQRFIDTAELFQLDTIVRVCADNPFLSSKYILKLIDTFNKQNADYISFKNKQGIPSIKTHYGFFAEIVKLSALKRVSELTNEQLYHEHVTNFIYTNKTLFDIKLFDIPFQENDKIRLTIDTQEDFDLAQTIYNDLSRDQQNIDPEMVLAYLNDHETYLELMNKQIQQEQK